MKSVWISFWKRFGFYPEPLTFEGIYGSGPHDWVVMTRAPSEVSESPEPRG